MRLYYAVQDKKKNGILDRCFISQFIIGIPNFIVSIYYATNNPENRFPLIFTIVLSIGASFLYERMQNNKK